MIVLRFTWLIILVVAGFYVLGWAAITLACALLLILDWRFARYEVFWICCWAAGLLGDVQIQLGSRTWMEFTL